MKLTHRIQSPRATVFTCYLTYIVQATFNYVPLLYVTFCNTFGLSYAQIGALIAVNFGTQLTMDFTSAFFLRRIGYRTAAILSCLAAALGLVCFSFLPFILPPFAGLCIAILLLSAGDGLTEVVVSPLLEACPVKSKRGAMAMLHSMYTWGTALIIAVSTLLFSVLGLDRWGTVACLWAILPLCTAVLYCLVPIYELPADAEKIPANRFLCDKRFWLLVCMMTMAGAAEMIMTQWASVFAENGLGVTKAAGDLLGPCLFSAAEAVTRVIYSFNAHKINARRFMMISSAVAVCGYAVAAFAPFAPLALGGCIVCGVGCAVLWPATYSEAAVTLPMGGAAMFSFLAFAGDIGCLSGPSLAGVIADGPRGLCGAFVFAMIFPTINIAVLAVLSRLQKKQKT